MKKVWVLRTDYGLENTDVCVDVFSSKEVLHKHVLMLMKDELDEAITNGFFEKDHVANDFKNAIDIAEKVLETGIDMWNGIAGSIGWTHIEAYETGVVDK